MASNISKLHAIYMLLTHSQIANILIMETEPSSDDDQLQTNLPRTIELIKNALAAVNSPVQSRVNVIKWFYTIKDDLTIIKWVYQTKVKGEMFNFNRMSVDLMNGRPIQSIRARYLEKLARLSNGQIRSMCDFLLLHKSDGIFRWRKSGEIRIKPIGNMPVSRPASRSRSTSKEKTPSRSSNKIKDNSLNRDLNLAEYSPPKEHELYRQSDKIRNIVVGLAEFTGRDAIPVYNLLKACSMDILILEEFIKDTTLKRAVMWTPQEDEMLMSCYKTGEQASTLIEYKGKERVNKRIQYLERIGAINASGVERGRE